MLFIFLRHVQPLAVCEQEKPKGIYEILPLFFLPLGCKIYIMVTQDTSPSGVAEVCDESLFGQAKTGSLGQVTVPKKIKINIKEKKGITAG